MRRHREIHETNKAADGLETVNYEVKLHDYQVINTLNLQESVKHRTMQSTTFKDKHMKVLNHRFKQIKKFVLSTEYGIIPNKTTIKCRT